MTEDTSHENLRKFLESDDPALVRMGLSMAKGSGVPEEILPIILKMYMLNEDKNIRAMAKSVFIKWAPTEIKAKVKENWKANYRTISITGEKYPEIVKPFLDAFKSNDDFAMIVLTPLLNIFSKKIESTDWEKKGWRHKLKLGEERKKAGKNLAKIADIRTVKTLTRILLRKTNAWSYEHTYKSLAAKALRNIGDSRVVYNQTYRYRGPLISFLTKVENINHQKLAIRILGKLGDERAVKPLLKTFEKENLGLTKASANAIIKIKEDSIGESKDNILKFLKSKDPAMVRMGASMLKGILEE